MAQRIDILSPGSALQEPFEVFESQPLDRTRRIFAESSRVQQRQHTSMRGGRGSAGSTNSGGVFEQDISDQHAGDQHGLQSIHGKAIGSRTISLFSERLGSGTVLVKSQAQKRSVQLIANKTVRSSTAPIKKKAMPPAVHEVGIDSSFSFLFQGEPIQKTRGRTMRRALCRRLLKSRKRCETK